jgi:hypothetical protein
MGSIRRRGVPIAAVAAGALVLPAAALGAVTKPAVTTGGATSIKQTSVVFHGTVDPNGAPTTYFFQAGATKIYGGQTTTTSAGKGTKPIKVTAVGTGFAPSTTYHYRLVAQNRKGLVVGKDRTFKTKKQPLGVTLAATPNPIRSGRSTTLAGVLSGTGNANRQVVLQANAWPYTGGFVNQSNSQVTSSTGAFSFPILSVANNTQYRVLMVARPEVVSPIVVLGTTVKVTRHAKVFPGKKRGRIHFWGTMTPAADAATVQIQKLRSGTWIAIRDTKAKATGKGYSRYSANVRQKHGGRYRVVAADPSGLHSVSISRSVRRHHLRG